jgi:hypothetical protein
MAVVSGGWQLAREHDAGAGGAKRCAGWKQKHALQHEEDVIMWRGYACLWRGGGQREEGGKRRFGGEVYRHGYERAW